MDRPSPYIHFTLNILCNVFVAGVIMDLVSGFKSTTFLMAFLPSDLCMTHPCIDLFLTFFISPENV